MESQSDSTTTWFASREDYVRFVHNTLLAAQERLTSTTIIGLGKLEASFTATVTIAWSDGTVTRLCLDGQQTT